MEKKQRVRENRYRILFDYSPNCLVETDWSGVCQYIKGVNPYPDSDLQRYFRDHPEKIRECLKRVNITAFNKAAEQLFGKPQETAADRSLGQLVAEDSFDVCARHLAALSQGVTEYTDELCIITPAEQRRRMLYYCQVVPGYENSLEKVILSFVDFTDRKRFETELERAYRVLESVTDATHVLLACLDTRFNFLWVNKAYARAGRRHPEDYIGKNHFDLYPHAENEAIFRKVAETGQPFSVRAKPFAHPDQPGRGNTYWDWRLDPLTDKHGNVEMLLFALTDVTEAEKTRQRRQESEARLRALIENLPFEFWAMGTNGRYIMQNQACQAVMGDRIGKKPEEVTSDPSILKKWQDNNRRAFAGEVVTEEVSYPRGGETRVFHNVIAPVQVGREIRGILGVNLDITERKQAEAELQQLNANLEHRVAERTQLAEARLKQLQTLTVQLIEAEEQERQRIAQLLHDDLQQILASARLHLQTACEDLYASALLTNVDQMLAESISKARSLSHELSPSILQHSGLIPALKWLTQKMYRQFGMAVELQAEAEPDIADASLKVFMFRAVQELLFNINKHAGVNEAYLSVSASNGELTINVSDHGKGFNPHGINSSDEKNGLGLLSIRERAFAIGGELKVASAPGEGSSFTLTVPLHSDG